MRMGALVRLVDMKIGEKGSIRRMNGRGEINRRMRDMGIIPGAHVEVEGRATLGDPIEIKIMGYHLTLRDNEAASIEVEKE